MPVYVDDMRMQATVRNGSRTVSARWSHLMADTHDELVDFAVNKLGMRESWIQHPGTPDEHFDVVEAKRLVAIRLGAISVPIRSDEWMELFTRLRSKWTRICANCRQPIMLSADGKEQMHRAVGTCLEPVGYLGERHEARAWALLSDFGYPDDPPR